MIVALQSVWVSAAFVSDCRSSDCARLTVVMAVVIMPRDAYWAICDCASLDCGG